MNELHLFQQVVTTCDREAPDLQERQIMNEITRIVAAGTLFLVAGCEVPAPTTDTMTPTVSLIVSQGRGNKIFNSVDGDQNQSNPQDSCIKVPETPTQLIMFFGDQGGIQFATAKVFPGRIVPRSVEIGPSSPEATFSIRTERGADYLEIELTPPSPGTVRTGAIAIFEVDGELPISITGSARDYAGNVAALQQVDVRAMDDPVVCRGDQ
jgi:hypothetical protein